VGDGRINQGEPQRHEPQRRRELHALGEILLGIFPSQYLLELQRFSALRESSNVHQEPTFLWGKSRGTHFMAKRRICGRHVSPATLLPALYTNQWLPLVPPTDH
jgi:hypothetical protein